MFYEQHKPGTEEAIANLELIQRDFWTHIASYQQKFNFIQNTFWNPFNHQQAINIGAISPKATYSTEMIELAFSINGFMNNIYQSLEYAIALWVKKNNYKLKENKNRFEEGMKKFLKINGDLFANPAEAKTILLEFRHGRNFFTHYGKIVTIEYIFVNSQIVFNAVGNILSVLKEQIHFNEESYQAFLDNKDEFIEVLSCLGNNYSQGLYLVG